MTSAMSRRRHNQLDYDLASILVQPGSLCFVGQAPRAGQAPVRRPLLRAWHLEGKWTEGAGARKPHRRADVLGE